ncbi:MAG: phosphoribosylformylglycinamidine synthase subunit PurQ [Planctomycetaceae bacterium]
MPTPRVLVLRAPGTNCDVETAYAFELCGAAAERWHLFRLIERPSLLREFQVLCIPGGFSYGDDVGAGAIFGAQLQWRLAEALGEFLAADRLALGICNGFQVLMRAGVLPDGVAGWPRRPGTRPDSTLTWNDNGRYTAKWVPLRAANSPSVFLRGVAELYLPIAHAEGKVAVRDDAVISRWRDRRQIALTYLPDANPNGSTADIAGLCDPTGRVLGLMPHPERHLFATQHPRWTRRPLTADEGEGLQLFRNAVEYFR